jgi:hypothetical protein
MIAESLPASGEAPHIVSLLLSLQGMVEASLIAHGRALVVLVGLGSLPVRVLQPQEPTGLAASALADPSFTWIRRSLPGVRVYFLAGSYPANHQDSLLARIPAAVSHARALIDSPPLTSPIDLFFIETRAQMTALIGGRATGFAQPSTRTVFLVTNPDWRAFERHELMHIVAQHAWGPPAPGTDWLQEGLAQAADGRCAGYSNADVMLTLTSRHGWIPLDAMLTRFRAQPDLRAYLQAAAFVGYLLQRYGPEPLEELWRRGSRRDSLIGSSPLAVIERRWREELRPREDVSVTALGAVESKGCG